MPRGKPLKNPNGYGSVVKLYDRRKNPFEVRVNTRMDEQLLPHISEAFLARLTIRGKPLSHAMQDHIKNLFTQMDKYALQNDIIDKGYASFAAITVEEDDTPGVPFTTEELQLLWKK
ncbi:MAG: hypothetical protein HDR27_02175 [Lachnospiraceae bacterium]|nr:hypothetical protein [Lachnospiraceae bacterium]